MRVIGKRQMDLKCYNLCVRKKLGDQQKFRRKQPHEVQGKDGPDMGSLLLVVGAKDNITTELDALLGNGELSLVLIAVQIPLLMKMS